MGRAKLPMKRIENKRNRQVSFSKRRNGLIKKAYELSVLTGIDIALIIFSPSGRLSHFSGKTRMEDVFTRFIDLPSREIESDFPNKENLRRTLQQLRSQNNASSLLPVSSSVNPDTEENLQQQISTLQQQLQAAQEEIRMYAPDSLEDKSLEEVESLENLLSNTLTRVSERKEYLLANMSPYNPSSSSVLQMPVNNQIKWLPGNDLSPSQMCSPSETLLPIGDLSSTILYQLRQEEEEARETSAWPRQLSPSIYYPQFQDTGAAEQMPNMGDQEITPCEQVEMAVTTTDITTDEEGTKQLQFNG